MDKIRSDLFPYPDQSATPLLDLQCTTKSSFYLKGDEQYDPPMMIIDANITNDLGTACETFSLFHVSNRSKVRVEIVDDMISSR